MKTTRLPQPLQLASASYGNSQSPITESWCATHAVHPGELLELCTAIAAGCDLAAATIRDYNPEILTHAKLLSAAADTTPAAMQDHAALFELVQLIHTGANPPEDFRPVDAVKGWYAAIEHIRASEQFKTANQRLEYHIPETPH